MNCVCCGRGPAPARLELSQHPTFHAALCSSCADHVSLHRTRILQAIKEIIR